jgi:alanine racemase
MRTLADGIASLHRPAWVEVDDSALASNVAVFREIVGPGVRVNAVVKADAYGHGLVHAAAAFLSAGADQLCVAGLDEALALRAAGITAPILVLFPSSAGSASEAATHDIQLTVTDVPALSKAQTMKVQVEVETGLSRGGVSVDTAPDLVRRLIEAGARIEGMWTHLAMAEDAEYTQRQVREFDRAVEGLRTAGLRVPSRHIGATGGVLTGRSPAYEGVRIGLGLYGLLPTDLPIPDELGPFAEKLRPAMALKARALRIETFAPGTRVSYGGRWTAERESVIATLPVGYGDAIPRPAPWGSALVRGRRVPLVGTVAMDAVMVDVTDIAAEGLDREDEFVLLGSQGSDEIGADELARRRNTIPWEVVTGVSQRITRVYYAGSVLTGMRTLNEEWRIEEHLGDGGSVEQ